MSTFIRQSTLTLQTLINVYLVIFDNDTNEFYFMEMNTRLQVEHPVTEEITGEDLVSWQFKIASGEKLPLTQEQIAQRIAERGWAFECRIYAENPDADFMPDSGKLLHLRTPELNEFVRIDAGFVEGDTVSSNYDGMIAKLIVSGPTRELALRRTYQALQEYEVVGLSTNIEFLKRICLSEDFMKGEVETGYIKKHHNELFSHEKIDNESYAQAALALLAKEAVVTLGGPHADAAGVNYISERQFSFASEGESKEAITVTIKQTSRNLYDIEVVGAGIQESYLSVVCESKGDSVTSFFPHSRVKTTVIANEDNLTLFQRGKKISLKLAQPKWLEKALGIKESANSVTAPMPCKVLRNEVKEGDHVEKDQALVVIESMKMETVIRSPHKGVVSKLVHKSGDICKAGTVLVLFEETPEAKEE